MVHPRGAELQSTYAHPARSLPLSTVIVHKQFLTVFSSRAVSVPVLPDSATSHTRMLSRWTTDGIALALPTDRREILRPRGTVAGCPPSCASVSARPPTVHDLRLHAIDLAELPPCQRLYLYPLLRVQLGELSRDARPPCVPMPTQTARDTPAFLPVWLPSMHLIMRWMSRTSSQGCVSWSPVRAKVGPVAYRSDAPNRALHTLLGFRYNTAHGLTLVRLVAQARCGIGSVVDRPCGLGGASQFVE